MIDTLNIGWAQTLLKGLLENESSNNSIYLYALRKTKITIEINHKNVFIYNSSSKYSLNPILQIVKIIKTNNIDILHCHLARSLLFGWIIKTFFYPKIKLVYLEQWRIYKNEKIYNTLLSLFKNKYNLFIANSFSTKNKLLNFTTIEEKKITVLYNSIDINRYKKIDKKDKYWFSDDDFIVWFAARFIKRKWREEFIKSADILKNHKDIKFIIAWDGAEKYQLLDKIKELWLTNIKYIGYVSDMVNFYNTINCFAMCSHREPMWLTQLEAQACQIPVITSNVDGLNETVDSNNTLFFNPLDYQTLANNILKIKNDIKFRENLIKNWLNNSKRFQYSLFLQQLNKIYEQL